MITGKHLRLIVPLTLCCASLCMAQGKLATPPQTPRLQLLAEFAEKTRCPVFRHDEPVTLWLAVDGHRIANDELKWSVKDYLGHVLDSGMLAVPKSVERWTSTLKLKNYGAGYFEVHLGLEASGVSIPRLGTKPPGFVAYGVLPPIEALPLAHVEDSRFGAQGTNFVKSGEFMKGDPFDPVYPLLGAKWVYLGRRLGELSPKDAASFKPQLDAATFKKHPGHEAQNGLCLLVDLHTIPDWLAKVPEGGSLKGAHATESGQRYAPNDFAAYKALVAKVVAEQVVRREALFPNQEHNYYQIHWEPDWTWQGSDEDFIMLYKTALEAIRKNDPKGLLLGPNYGVLRTGNGHLKRLFAKGLGQYLDGVLTHTYYIDTRGHDQLADDVRELVAMTRANLKPGAKIINTEWGVSWAKGGPGENPEALRDEAAEFMRGHLITLGEGVDATFYFYTADIGVRYGGGLLYNLTSPNPGCGATHVAPKPVFMAAATATRLLEGTKSLGALEQLGDKVTAYAFDRNGETILCLWAKDGKPSTVKIPAGNVAKTTLLDPMGNAKEIPTENHLASVELSAIPVWLRGVDRSILPDTGLAESLKAYPGATAPLAREGRFRLLLDGTWLDIGAEGRLTVPKNAAAGKRLLGVFSPDGNELRSCHNLEVLPLLALSQPTEIIPGALVVDAANHGEKDATGTIQLALDGKTCLQQDISLVKGKAQRLVFDLRQAGVAFPVTGKLVATFTNQDGASCSLAAPPPKPVVEAARVQTAPVIDGKLGDWLLERFNAMADKKKPEASKKLSPLLGAQYDGKNLYLAFKIRDKSHVQGKGHNDMWRQDSIQLGIAVHPEANGWRTWQKLCFGLNTTLGRKDAFRDMGNAFPRGVLRQGEISWGIVRQGEETFYEIAIPWNQIDKSLGGPPPEGALGLGVMVNNVDVINPAGAMSTREGLDVLGGMGWSQPGDFGVLELK